MDLNLICMLHLYCIAMIHLKTNAFEHGFHNRVGSQITETLQCWFLYGIYLEAKMAKNISLFAIQFWLL